MKLPQLSLRDLFWLSIVLLMAVAWWIDDGTLRMGWGMAEESRRNMIATMERMKTEMKANGYQWDPSSQRMVNLDAK